LITRGIANNSDAEYEQLISGYDEVRKNADLYDKQPRKMVPESGVRERSMTARVK